jgi:hypothetical protein
MENVGWRKWKLAWGRVRSCARRGVLCRRLKMN